MASQAEMKAMMFKYVERVNSGDVQGVVALYADDAVIEDPVGVPTQVGRAAITEFYAGACASGARVSIVAGPFATLANSAAMAAQVLVTIPGKGPSRIGLAEVMTFDDRCRITSMRAYWGPEDITAA